jgi:F-type H+-transporting ATPase subunit delta
MKISKQARRGAKQLFRSCLANGVLDEGRVRLAVKRVLEVKPRGFMPILSHFERLLRLEIERRTARVESAIALTPDIQAKIQAGLTKRHGQGLIFSFHHNPELIGGLRIKVGSDVYDSSIQSRLAALQASF